MEKNIWKYAAATAGVLVCGCLWFFAGKDNSMKPAEDEGISLQQAEEQNDDGAVSTAGKIYIHITGAVRKPGVYIFDGKPRVIEVVEKAGGFKKNANQSAINQAELVEDGTQLVIDFRAAKKTDTDGKGRQSAGGEQADSGLVNINTAAKEELMTLTGIGESKALSIISYREKNGTFQKCEDIMNITGIKNGVFEKIKNQIRV